MNPNPNLRGFDQTWLHFFISLCGIHHLTSCRLIGFGRNRRLVLVALPSLSIVNLRSICAPRRPPLVAINEKRSDLQVATASFRKSMVCYIYYSPTDSDSTRGSGNRLNQTMTSSEVGRRASVGDRREKHARAGATRRASSNGRKPGSLDQPATRNRIIRWSCPCFPWVLVLSRRATWHRAGIRVSLFPPVVTVIFQTLGQLPSDPSDRNAIEEEARPQVITQDDLQEAGSRYP